MKKNYWWRIGLIVLCLIILSMAFIGPCNLNIEKCLGGDSIFITRTFFHIFLSLFLISPFLFFINDNIFLKWLRFALIWILLSIILIALVPVSTGGWMNFGPTKESVSIWMGSLLFIISLGLISYQSYKARKK
jgi:hypothetical protein